MHSSLLSTMPEPTESTHTQVADDLTTRLLNAAGYQVKKRFCPESTRQALSEALADALLSTVDEFTDEQDSMAPYFQAFGGWSKREAVAGELSQLIDPRDDTELDLELLREEYEALGYTPDPQEDSVTVETFVTRFAGMFRDAVAERPALQEPIPIDRLHAVVGRAERQHGPAPVLRPVRLAEEPAEPQPPDVNAEDRRYLTGLTRKLNRLPLGGLVSSDGEPARTANEIGLRRVYVDLDTTSSMQRDAPSGSEPVKKAEGQRQPEGALEALASRRQMVLLGGPGSGKTTFLRYVALRCAASWQREPQADLGPLAALNQRLFPLVASLQQFAAGLNENTELRYGVLLDHLRHVLDCDHALPTYWPKVRRRLLKGETILLLDGYDEVGREQRPLVAAVVRDLLDHFPEMPLLITCRTRAYKLEELPELPIHEASLAPLSSECVRQFGQAWYDQVAQLSPRHDEEWAKERRQNLLEAIDEDDHLGGMAGTPLSLTIMAQVNARRQLPNSRVEAYGEVLDNLLWEWDHLRSHPKAGEGLADLVREAGKDRQDFLAALAELTFEQQHACDDQEAHVKIPESELTGTLCAFRGGALREQTDWAARVIDVMSRRSGVLRREGDRFFSYTHPSFQAYLAAAHIAEREKPATVVALTHDGDRWHDLMPLVASYLVYRGQEARALSYVDELLPRQPRTEIDWMQVKLAGDMLAVIPPELLHNLRRGEELAAQVPEQLARLLDEGALAPVERAGGGVILSRLGDPRFEAAYGLPEDLDSYFAPISGGTFTMGTTAEEVAEIEAHAEWYTQQWAEYRWLDKEQPAHSVTVADFRMGCYPITNAQYLAFIDDGGYAKAGLETWWPAMGREAWREGRIHRWNAEDGLPGRWDDRALNQPNAPLVGVTWFEAVAYCNWLTAKLRRIGYLGNEQAIRLPTEAEWEYAARGQERRAYPWGDTWNPKALNWKGTGLNAPSAVGAFPAGATPDTELLDMAGNVWEWCQTRWGDYVSGADAGRSDSRRESELSDMRCLRGGCWDGNEPGEYRCAARYGLMAHLWSDSFGFRVVVSRLS